MTTKPIDDPIELDVLKEIVNDLSLEQLKRLYEWMIILKDAKLGRMVRKALQSSAGIYSQRLQLGPHYAKDGKTVESYWASLVDATGERTSAYGNTPEAALETVGIEDD